MNLESYYKNNHFLSTAEKNSNEILGFRRGVNTVFTFLVCHVAYIDNRLSTFVDSLFTFQGGTLR
jgi:hypothetical protein